MGMRRRGTARALLVIPALTAAATLIGSPAWAEDDEHLDPRPVGWVDTPSPQADAKIQVAEAWLAAATATGRRSPISGIASSTDATVQRYQALSSAYVTLYGELPAVPAVTSPASGAGIMNLGAPSSQPPASKLLTVTSYGQENGYFCGPAVGQTIMAFKGITKSRQNGASLSQTALASSAHMNTAYNRETSVWGNNMNYGLNRWRSGSSTGFYVRTMFTGSVGVSQFRSAFLYNLNGNEPFAVSTGENAGINPPTYNGHLPPSSGQRGHWITARGYSGYGPTTTNMSGSFADPMWTRQTGVAKFFSATNLTTFYSTFVAGRGIVW